MHDVFEHLFASGQAVTTSRGKTLELLGVQLELGNPRARLSRSETRGTVFSCLGEFLWYLSGDNQATFIKYYLPDYPGSTPEGIVPAAYGPRLFSRQTEPTDQINFVIALLRRKPTSRRAVVQVYDASDHYLPGGDVPCTCTLQFVIRDVKLHMFASMRSNDAMKGLPHDVFCFTMLQELIARSLDVELGCYRHNVASLHLYDPDRPKAASYVKEGWQSKIAMPPMPIGDPWEAVSVLRKAEEAVRKCKDIPADVRALDEYWQDLVTLLQLFRSLAKAKDPKRAKELRASLRNDAYGVYIDDRMGKLAPGASTDLNL